MRRIISVICIAVVVVSFIVQTEAITGPWIRLPGGRKRGDRSILNQVSIIINLFESTG